MFRTWRLAVLVFVCTATCLGQVITGSLQGVVKDPQGNVIADSQITITEEATNAKHSMATNSQGSFRFNELNIGQYRVDVEKSGFKKFTTTVQVGLGDSSALNIQLQIGEVTQSVVVSAQMAPVQTTTAEMAREVPGSLIVQLPVLDRDPTQLLQLEPGVPAIVSDKNGTYTVAGMGPRSTTYNVDGSSNNFDVSSGQITPVIMEAVAQMHMVTAIFSPQYGKGSGAVVDILMRSGSNQWHGGVFEYNRNTIFNANSYFANAAGVDRTPYNENIYGFTLGGPIRKNKLFFFAAFEGDNVRQSAVQSLVLPSNQYRTPDLTDPSTLANNPVVASTIMSVFARMPSCVAATEGCNYFSNQTASSDQYLGNLKVDYSLNNANLLSARLMIRNYDQTQDTALTNLNVLGTGTDYNTALTYHHIFSSNLVNELIATGAGYQTRSAIPITGVPDVGISGYSGIGGSSNLPQAFTNTNYEFEDNLSWVRGKHSFRFGADVMRTSTVGEADFNSRGVYSVIALPAPYGTADALTNFRLGRAYSFTQDTGDFARRFANPYVSVYAQDDWKLGTNFTLNLGLRFQQQLAPAVTDTGNGQVAYEAFNPTTFQFAHIPNDDRGFSPFLGFAWDLHGNGSSSLRAGYRRSYDLLVLDYYDIGAILQPPLIQSLSVTLPQVSAVPVGDATSVAKNAGLPISLMLNSNTTKLPRADAWEVSFQQRLMPRAVLETSYVGTAGRQLAYAVATNRIDPTTKVRPNSSYGAVALVNSIAYSNYDGLLVNFTYNLSPTLYLTSSYTWSKALDVAVDPAATFGSEASVGAEENYPGTQDPDMGKEYGRSVFDRPNAFAAAVVYQTPNWIHSRLGGALLNGWNASTIVLAQTGIPFTVFAGADLNQDGLNNDRPDILNPNILGTSYNNPSQVIPASAFNGAATPVRNGDLGRNTFRQDGVTNVDLSFSKLFPVRHEAKLEFRGQFFNLFNHPQFGAPTNTLTSPSFGKILSQQNSPRQVELGLRLRF